MSYYYTFTTLRAYCRFLQGLLRNPYMYLKVDYIIATIGKVSDMANRIIKYSAKSITIPVDKDPYKRTITITTEAITFSKKESK